ncbi:HisA/HisF-related TIM barrel protein [Planctomycetota bacterium]
MNGIIPVIDLKRGQVVHAIAGDRDNYQPIQSCLTNGSSPSAIATAFRQRGFKAVYVADLDAITEDGDNSTAYGCIRESGLSIWLDRGITDSKTARHCIDEGIAKVIIGLESVTHVEQVSSVLQTVGPASTVVSVDMKNGNVLTQKATWQSQSSIDVATELIDLGVQDLILLDLSRVGTGLGTGTESLCRQIKKCYPDAKITVGGGVSNQIDVDHLLRGGADHVLVATALHRGQL